MTISNIAYQNYNTKNYVKPFGNQKENDTELSMMDMIREKMDEIADKVQKGETETKIQTGAQALSAKEWERLIKKVDSSIQKDQDASDVLKEAQTTDKKKKVPYECMAKDGIIEYKGTVFVCDYEHNALCLGDTSDKNKCINVSLPSGGSLIVNRENLGQLAGAIDMFTPEDVNAILRAITKDTKIQQLKKEIDDDKNGIGSAEE